MGNWNLGEFGNTVIGKLEFIGNDGHSYGPSGNQNNNPWTSSPQGCTLAYMSGKSSNLLISLQLHYDCKSRHACKYLFIYLTNPI